MLVLTHENLSGKVEALVIGYLNPYWTNVRSGRNDRSNFCDVPSEAFINSVLELTVFGNILHSYERAYHATRESGDWEQGVWDYCTARSTMESIEDYRIEGYQS